LNQNKSFESVTIGF